MNKTKLAEIDQNLENSSLSKGVSIDTLKHFIQHRGRKIYRFEAIEGHYEELSGFCDLYNEDEDRMNSFITNLFEGLKTDNAQNYDIANEFEVPSGYPYVIIVPSSGHDGEGTELYWSKYPGMSEIFNFDISY